MLRGGNMRFRPAIFFSFVFTQSFFKFHKNGDIRKLKVCSFRLWKNYFCRLYNKRARALQSWITFFWYTLYSERSYTFSVLLNALRNYNGNVKSRYFNKLQSLYNPLLSIGLILFCRQQVYYADGHSIGGDIALRHPPPPHPPSVRPCSLQYGK